MSNDQSNVIHLHQRDLAGALERLNRITGLQFSRWPESLVPTGWTEADASAEAGPVIETAPSECRLIG